MHPPVVSWLSLLSVWLFSHYLQPKLSLHPMTVPQVSCYTSLPKGPKTDMSKGEPTILPRSPSPLCIHTIHTLHIYYMHTIPIGWMCPSKIHTLNLISKVMVLGGGAFGAWLGHEEGGHGVWAHRLLQTHLWPSPGLCHPEIPIRGLPITALPVFSSMATCN